MIEYVEEVGKERQLCALRQQKRLAKSEIQVDEVWPVNVVARHWAVAPCATVHTGRAGVSLKRSQFEELHSRTLAGGSITRCESWRIGPSVSSKQAVCVKVVVCIGYVDWNA